ncbi:hypothetical protein ABZT08_29865 [Streptomyces sp. NPDC005526]
MRIGVVVPECGLAHILPGGLGHTDPQLVIPYGGLVRVDGPARRITVHY